MLGPNVYEDYTTAPIGAILKYNYITFSFINRQHITFYPDGEQLSPESLQACLEEVQKWMAANWLKLNDSKTRFIIFDFKQNLSNLSTVSVTLGESHIMPSTCIDAHIDSTLKMEKQLAATCKAACYYLHMISKNRKYLTEEQTKPVWHARVTFWLHQNNSLLLGLQKKLLTQLQHVQNASGRPVEGLVTSTLM